MTIGIDGLSVVDDLMVIWNESDIRYKMLYKMKPSNFLKWFFNTLLKDIEGFTNNEEIEWDRFDNIYAMLIGYNSPEFSSGRMYEIVFKAHKQVTNRIALPNGFKVKEMYPWLILTNDT